MTMRITPLTDPNRGASSYRLAWLAAGDDGRPLGTAFLRVPAVGDSGEVELHVHPAERRGGVGTRHDEAGAVQTFGQPLILRSSIWRCLVRKPPPEIEIPAFFASSTMRR